MATARDIRHFFPKAAVTEVHANSVASVEVPRTDLLLTVDGTPVLWVKSKPGTDGLVLCVYTTVGLDFTLSLPKHTQRTDQSKRERVRPSGVRRKPREA